MNTTHKNTIHKRKTRIYSIWSGMKGRCLNKNDDSYNYYGGKGVTVCEDWKNSFVIFRDWAIANGYNDSLSIDRKNTYGDYCPDNCRFTSVTIQNRNTRLLRQNNTSGYRGVTFDKSRNLWKSSITVDKKHKNLGRYKTSLEAAKAFDEYIIKNNLEHTKNF